MDMAPLLRSPEQLTKDRRMAKLLQVRHFKEVLVFLHVFRAKCLAQFEQFF